MRKYLGHDSQIYGVEELRLVGGKGDGMRLLQVRNGSGLEFTVSADRCADISRLSLGGVNYGYFSPCGYVSPKYYDNDGTGFLKSFTAGFLTTCGLSSVGNPCVDDGETLPLHGTISNTPAENLRWEISQNDIRIHATVRDEVVFSHGLVLKREYIVPLMKNELYITDTVTNTGYTDTPLQMLYHFNIGYPLLDENTVLEIPSDSITPRNDHAATDIDNCLRMEPPQCSYEEMCYYHDIKGDAEITVFNPKIGKGFVMSYDNEALPYFTEWKMMGERDYVLGVEPGNTLPDGRNLMRERGLLEFLKVGESKKHKIKFIFTEK